MNFSEATQQIRALAWDANEIREGFSLMANSISIAAGTIFAGCTELSVTFDQEKRHIDVSHFDTNIRLQLFLGLDAKGAAIGRVVCLHRYSMLEMDAVVPLGAFQFDRSLRTSFGSDERGYPIQMQTHANLIVAYYLQQAYVANGAMGS
jgi:hypothetical protein